MKTIKEISQNPKVEIITIGADGGMCKVWTGYKRKATVIFSFGSGWDHVSVSFKKEMPTWEDMCKIKDIFFYEDECVIQYHPIKSEYVNFHNYCLHLWRPQNFELPTPPTIFV